MATQHWLNTSGDGLWATAGNWTSAVPISGDTVIFNGDGNTAVTDPSGQGAVDLALLYIDDTYTKDIGSDASKLQIGADKIVHRGKGGLYLSNPSAVTIDELIVAHTGTNQNLALQAGATGAGNAITRISISSGRCRYSFPNIGSVDDITVSSASAHLTLAGAVAGVSRLLIDKGTVVTESEVSSFSIVYNCGGTLVLNPLATAATPVFHISCGGRIEWNNDTVAIQEANLYDGLLDLTQTGEEKTVTLARIWPKGDFKYNPDLTTVTAEKEWDGTTNARG